MVEARHVFSNPVVCHDTAALIRRPMLYAAIRPAADLANHGLTDQEVYAWYSATGGAAWGSGFSSDKCME